MSYGAGRIPLATLLAAFLLACMPAAHAESQASIRDMHPSGSAILGRNGMFYVRIAYHSDEPISIWARPYRNGKEVPAMSNASITHQGNGEAMGWFSLVEPGDVDEVRINAGGGEPYKEWQLASESVQLRWTTGASAEESPPQWVNELRAVEEAQRRADAERRASEPVTGGDVAFFSGFMLLVLALGVGGIVVPAWSAWKWQGAWRVMALVPVCIIGFVVLRIVVDTARDPTSHNLWPFEIIMFGGLALGIIAVLKLVRRWVGAQA